MDIVGGVLATQIAKGLAATLTVEAMTFRKSVIVGNGKCITPHFPSARMSRPGCRGIAGRSVFFDSHLARARSLGRCRKACDPC